MTLVAWDKVLYKKRKEATDPDGLQVTTAKFAVRTRYGGLHVQKMEVGSITEFLVPLLVCSHVELFASQDFTVPTVIRRHLCPKISIEKGGGCKLP